MKLKLRATNYILWASTAVDSSHIEWMQIMDYNNIMLVNSESSGLSGADEKNMCSVMLKQVMCDSYT